MSIYGKELAGHNRGKKWIVRDGIGRYRYPPRPPSPAPTCDECGREVKEYTVAVVAVRPIKTVTYCPSCYKAREAGR